MPGTCGETAAGTCAIAAPVNALVTTNVQPSHTLDRGMANWTDAPTSEPATPSPLR
jgi:hypothetical protein